MMDTLLGLLVVAGVNHQDAARWRSHGVSDFEDALQVASAVAGGAEVIVTRNVSGFRNCPLPVMTPEEFLTAYS